MDANADFRDLLQSLNREKARYLVVGGYAVIFHTEPRYTKDLDLWVDPTGSNAGRVHRALARFGAPVAAVTIEDLKKPGNIVILGRAPNRIDVITSVAALDFGEAWANRVAGTYAGEPVNFLSAADLIRNKRAVARPQDLMDATKIEEWTRPPKPRRKRPAR